MSPLFAILNSSLSPILWMSLGLLTAVGILALLSPHRFASLSTRGSRWVDTERLLEQLDRRVDVDRHILPYSRLLGFAVLASVAMIAALVSK